MSISGISVKNCVMGMLLTCPIYKQNSLFSTYYIPTRSNEMTYDGSCAQGSSIRMIRPLRSGRVRKNTEKIQRSSLECPIHKFYWMQVDAYYSQASNEKQISLIRMLKTISHSGYTRAMTE